MATVTHDLGAFDNGAVLFTYDYDDVKLQLLAVRCANGSALPAFGQATSTGTGQTVSQTFPANATTVVNITANQQSRFQLTVRPDGKIDGVEYALRWPA